MVPSSRPLLLLHCLCALLMSDAESVGTLSIPRYSVLNTSSLNDDLKLQHRHGATDRVDAGEQGV